MSRTGVIFGAGNIGRGFIAQLFHESGLEVVFVEARQDFVEALNARRGYEIHVVGPDAQIARIDGVRAVSADDLEDVAEAVSHCEIACTAVGAGALRQVADVLAGGLTSRQELLNILICENLRDAETVLRRNVADALPASQGDAI